MCTVGFVAGMVRFFMEIHTVDLAVECLVTDLLYVTTCLRLISPSIYEDRRLQLYDHIIFDWSRIMIKEERSFLVERAKSTYRFFFIYMSFIFSASSMYMVFPMVEMLYADFFTNVTVKKELPYKVELFIDQDKYFYPLMVYSSLGCLWGVAVIIAHDFSYCMTVDHVCCLYVIIRMRLVRATKLIKRIEEGRETYQTIGKDIDKLVVEAIELHNMAMIRIKIIDKIYGLTWLFNTLSITLSIGGGLLVVLNSINDNNVLKMARISIAFVTFWGQLYFIFYPGQKVIDNSVWLFEACYSMPWYYMPKRSVILIRMMSIQSLRPCQLTAAYLLHLDMETFMKV
ncbi:uncharacterized protein LOC106647123 [Copidosoma floridanum]|uniref:uncharacterized protein LOC106647123 n=1 Tax=Copidosoma floridanum TaxID=29053 RepID=UPI0006C9CC86|nr:uncharacterized protein LOC106647123 [Copidosoma floridanum]